MIAVLLFGLDPNLHDFKGLILASETLPSAANVYSHLLHSSLGQGSIDTTLESSTLVSSGGVMVVVVVAFMEVMEAVVPMVVLMVMVVMVDNVTGSIIIVVVPIVLNLIVGSNIAS